MDKRISYLFLVIVLTAVFPACKKYEEGPSFSMRTKLCRVTGVWDVEYFEIDGIDSTTYILNDTNHYKIYFKSGQKACVGDGYHPLDLIFVNKGNYIACGGWNFIDKKNYLSIHTPYDSLPYYNSGNGNWSMGGYIQRLTNKELWIKTSTTTIGAHNLYIKFKKVSEKP